jgi:hypothetical protein
MPETGDRHPFEILHWLVMVQPQGSEYWDYVPRLRLAVERETGQDLAHLEWQRDDGTESVVDFRSPTFFQGNRRDAGGTEFALHGNVRAHATDLGLVNGGLVNGDLPWSDTIRVFALERPPALGSGGPWFWLLDDEVSPPVRISWRDGAGNSAALIWNDEDQTVTGWYRPAGGPEQPVTGHRISRPELPAVVEDPGPTTIEEWRAYLPGPGFAPAAEEQIQAVERRLDVVFPPSYRAFLHVSNGFDDLDPEVSQVRPVQNVGWFRDVESELYGWWNEPGLEHVTEVLARCVAIGQGDDGDYWLMDPTRVDEQGEWTAYVWHPSDGEEPDPKPSFGALVAAGRAAFW